MIEHVETESEKIERLFQAAIRMSSEECEEFLARECQDNKSLKREVEELLQSAHNTGPLDHPPETPIDFAQFSTQITPRIPKQIGQYKIVQVIASGGMGTVYEARQQQPRRTVALKVMRWELSSREALQRFHYESELLAKLHHPGIAQVYDAGIHDEAGLRLPYFAMEMVVSAKPITEYARENDLTLREKLSLFAQVCDAVEYGHQRGIVHRDLKPSNIVVGKEGRPRLIDFGVARCTASDTTLTSLGTETGQLLGTLQYMSPEQCLGKNDQIDTRSDVYMLGVVLFELLSGRLPYDVRGMSIYEGTQAVIDSKPKTLSSVDQTLRGEIEIVVHKAMEKDRDRRYGTAGDLAADVRRYLHGEAIMAQPPTVAYQLKVFARRNKTLVVATACVLIALAVGLISTSAALFKANQALLSSQSLSHELSNSLSVAMSTVISVDPTAVEISYGDELTTEELVDRVSQLVVGEIEFSEIPLDEAQLRLKLGRAYRHMGRFTDAKPHLERAKDIRQDQLGVHPKVAECLLDLDYVYEGLGLQEGHYNGANQIVAWFESGRLPSCRPVGIAYRAQGWQLYEQLQLEEAIRSHDLAIEVFQQVEGPASRQIARCLNNRGVVYGKMKKFDKQYDDYQRALDMRLSVLGPDHSHTVHTYLNLARNAVDNSDLDAALRWAQKGWDGVNRLTGIDEDHQYFLTALDEYGEILYRLGEYEKAEPILRKCVATRERHKLDLTKPRWQLGICLMHVKRFDESEKLLLANYESDVQQALIRNKSTYPSKACERLVLLYNTWAKPDRAAKWRKEVRRLEAIDAKHRPNIDPVLRY
jgi:serine/threonine protein kinase